MKKWMVATVLVSGLVCAPLRGATAETIRLKNGNIITGDVLADKAEFVAIDLGFSVLEIPRGQVESIEEDTADKAQAVPEAEQKTLYMIARLKRRTVKELAAAFGEGVVKVQTPKGVGSGFFINQQGHLITNAHVIQGETQISVSLFVKEGESFSRRKISDVEIIAINPMVDVALLKAQKPEDVELVTLYFGDMDRVRTGDPVFAIGNPLGFERTVSEGIVSHKARYAEQMLLIQTTAPINPGNSGGPLLNMRGEVIGVTNLKWGYFAEGMGFAVPISEVKRFLKFQEAYAYDKDNPNAGYQYLEPPRKGKEGAEGNEEQEEVEEHEQQQ